MPTAPWRHPEGTWALPGHYLGATRAPPIRSHPNGTLAPVWRHRQIEHQPRGFSSVRVQISTVYTLHRVFLKWLKTGSTVLYGFVYSEVFLLYVYTILSKCLAKIGSTIMREVLQWNGSSYNIVRRFVDFEGAN